MRDIREIDYLARKCLSSDFKKVAGTTKLTNQLNGSL